MPMAQLSPDFPARNTAETAKEKKTPSRQPMQGTMLRINGTPDGIAFAPLASEGRLVI